MEPEEIEQKAYEEKKKRKPRMKVSGKSVFLLSKKANETEKDK